MFWLQMSAIIVVAALILFWWIYSAGREVDSRIYPNEDDKGYTISFTTKDYSGLCIWRRKLTAFEINTLKKTEEIVETFSDPLEIFIKYKDLTYITRNQIRRLCEDVE